MTASAYERLGGAAEPPAAAAAGAPVACRRSSRGHLRTRIAELRTDFEYPPLPSESDARAEPRKWAEKADWIADREPRRDETRGLQRLRSILLNTSLTLGIFAFIIGVSCFVAPWAMDMGADKSATRVGTYSPSNFSACPVRVLSDRLRPDGCATALPRPSLRWQRCC
jgi:hypothetical protein